MSSTTSSTRTLRIVSRRAQALMKEHVAAKKTPAGAPHLKGNPKDNKNTETPWPKSIRYTFYTACAAAVPFSVGSVIAMSPRLRDSLADEIESDVLTNKVVHLVRQYWGSYDYLPPIDRPLMNHVVPGRRFQWQEDNWSSVLKSLGRYRSCEGASTIGMLKPKDEIPISLENEAPASIRHERSLLARYLSPEYNPSGVNAMLSLIPCDVLREHDASTPVFECNIPANASLLGVRGTISASNLSDVIPQLERLFPGVNLLRSSGEDIGWGGTYRFALDFNSFSVARDSVEHSSADLIDNSSETRSEVINSKSNVTSKAFLRHTSIHSSWSYFPDCNTVSNTKANPSKVSQLMESSVIPTKKNKDLNSDHIEQLKNRIAALEEELKDPSSLRDRDDMYSELYVAKQELNGIKPKWWKRIWG